MRSRATQFLLPFLLLLLSFSSSAHLTPLPLPDTDLASPFPAVDIANSATLADVVDRASIYDDADIFQVIVLVFSDDPERGYVGVVGRNQKGAIWILYEGKLPLGLRIAWDVVDSGSKRYYHVYWEEEYGRLSRTYLLAKLGGVRGGPFVTREHLWSYEIDLSSDFAGADEQEIIDALAVKQAQVGLTDFRRSLEGGIDAVFELIPGAELQAVITGKTLTGRKTSRIQAAGWAAVGILIGAKLNVSDEAVELATRRRLIPEFSSSMIDDVVRSSTRGRSAQITEGARGIAKKQGHAARLGIQSAFDGVKPTQANADAIIRDVLQSPADRFIGDKVIDVYNAAGQGVRFEKGTGRFIGFLEGALKSQ